jgi:acyl-CoA thioesterase-1
VFCSYALFPFFVSVLQKGFTGEKIMTKIRCATALLLLSLAVCATALMRPGWAADPTILVLGDSLSASYGISVEEGWVSLLQQRLRENGLPHRVVNASISGDTSRGGRARLPAALERHRPNVVILELGGNDGLRGLPLAGLRENLIDMIEMSRAAGAQVILAEIRLPPNYGPRYTEKFQGIYRELAKDYDLTLIPFLLEGVAGHAELMQQDGIHPRAEAQPLILDNVWPTLQASLEAGT